MLLRWEAIAPFLFRMIPMFGEGRGEVLTKIAGKPSRQVSRSGETGHTCVNCGCFCRDSTTTSPAFSSGTCCNSRCQNGSYLLKNDFEDSVFRKHPAIQLIKEKLYSMGAQYASMSGSGSAVFGIFDTEVSRKISFRTQRFGLDSLIVYSFRWISCTPVQIS